MWGLLGWGYVLLFIIFMIVIGRFDNSGPLQKITSYNTFACHVILNTFHTYTDTHTD